MWGMSETGHSHCPGGNGSLCCKTVTATSVGAGLTLPLKSHDGDGPM